MLNPIRHRSSTIFVLFALLAMWFFGFAIPAHAAWTQASFGGSITQRLFFVSQYEIYGIGLDKAIWRWNGGGSGCGSRCWARITQGSIQSDFVLLSNSASNIFAFGLDNGIWQWDGGSWSQASSGGSITQRLFYAASTGKFYGIGLDGHIWRWIGGGAWKEITTSGIIKNDFVLVNDAEDDIYGFGVDNQVYHWNGSQWRQTTYDGQINKRLLYIASNKIYGIGLDNNIWRWNGGDSSCTMATCWTQITNNTPVQDFYMVNNSENDIYALGTDGQIWHWAPAPSFDYTLAANSGNVTAPQGLLGSNAITATLSSGAAQAVSFAASGLPTGATALFSQSSCNPTCSSILTIATSPTTPIGSYQITVTGLPLNKITTFTFTVNPPLLTPNVYYSAWAGDGSDDGTQTNPGIGWIKFSGANYGVNVAADGTLSGYAWANPNDGSQNHIGWIDFHPSLAGAPASLYVPNQTATLVRSGSDAGKVLGWARAVNYDAAGGWDGWIGFGSGGNYTQPVTVSGCNWSGYGWGGGTVIGWIHFAGPTYSVTGSGTACSTVPVTVSTGSITINATQGGSSWIGSVNYTLSGSNGNPTYTSVPITVTDQQAGSYTVTYNSGGPLAGATLLSITPSPAQSLLNGGSTKDDFAFISENDIYAIGLDNQIWHWNGSAWSQFSFGGMLQSKLKYVSPTQIYGIGLDNGLGNGGSIWRYNGGSSWTNITQGGTVKDDFVMVNNDENNIYAIGLDNQIWHWNGSAWSQFSFGGMLQSKLKYVSPTQIYGIGLDNGLGNGGSIWRYNGGSSWTNITLGGIVRGDFVLNSESDIYGIGLDNQIWHWNGSWSQASSGGQITQKLFYVSPTQMYGIGNDNNIWKWTGGSNWARVTANSLITFTMNFSVPAPAPTATISADSTSIPYNTATIIRWSSTNATSCTVSPLGWTGIWGNQATGNLTSSQTYTVNCSGAGSGSASASVTVTVVGAPPPAPTSPSATTAPDNACKVINVSWTNSAGAAGYNINRCAASCASVAASLPSSPFQDTTVADGTAYTYQIFACNGFGCNPTPAITPSVTNNAPEVSFSYAPSSNIVINQLVKFAGALIRGSATTSQSWTFAGGTPASSVSPSPSASFSTVGTHAVSYAANNASGSCVVSGSVAVLKNINGDWCELPPDAPPGTPCP